MPFARKQEAQDPRSLQARIDAAMGKPQRRRRGRRYVVGAFLTLVAVWSLVAAYITLTPLSFSSRWTLILPGSGSQMSVSLESIGQASSAPTPQFSGPGLSPKVIYKEIAQSEAVRLLAAEKLGIHVSELGRPRVRLIEETSLILFEIRAGTPEEAQQRGEALNWALAQQLDKLRRDELDKRAAVVRDNLRGYQEQVVAARARIVEAQRRSGLASVGQWNELSNSAVIASRKLTEVRAEIERLSSEQALLSARLGVGPRLAGLALRVAADPSAARLAADFAEAHAKFAGDEQRFGPANPLLVIAGKRRDGLLVQLQQAVDPVAGEPTSATELERLAAILNGSHHAELLRIIVAGEAQLAGRRKEAVALDGEVERLQAEVRRHIEAAARLEDLRKDQIVAEAVLTSAMARLDTSKADLYGSYPLVQVLAPPDLASFPSQPVPALAVAGGLAASLLATFAWMLAWWVPRSGRGRRKSA